MTNPLLDKALKAILENAEQSEAFPDSCSITGDDFERCIFCGESNQKNPRTPVVHGEGCVYLDAVAHFAGIASK